MWSALMKQSPFKNFIPAFLVQKLAEYVVLSLCLAAQVCIGSRLPNRFDWGVFVPGEMGIGESLQAGLGVALLFFTVTLYPVVTLIVVASGRRMLGARAQGLVQWLSAVVSVGYVALWVALTRYPATLVPFWAVTAIMAAFIVASSAAIYPPMQPTTEPSNG
jgi:hypothetical protein